MCVVPMGIDRVLAAAFESGDFEPLGELYAADALLDWSMPGGRARVVGCAIALFDHQTGRAAQAEIDREREPDRAAADDQDRTVDGCIGRHECLTGALP